MQIRSPACSPARLLLAAFAADPKATPEEARKFINDAEQKLLVLGVDAGRADWIKSTYITDDSEAVAASSTSAPSPPPSTTPRSPPASTASSSTRSPRARSAAQALPHHRHALPTPRRARS